MCIHDEIWAGKSTVNFGTLKEKTATLAKRDNHFRFSP